ncbi:unnamed protein product, partial [Candidula unifasciata]
MEFSPQYTRKLSGSSTISSFKEDALEQLEFNINDISRASSPASVISTSARSEGHGWFKDRRHRHSGRGEEEYRRRYFRMKAELELERMKALQLQQEREAETRKWKDAFENDKRLQIAALHKRMQEEKTREIGKLKEDLLRQKDFELQQVLLYRESERNQQHQTDQQQTGQQKVHRVVETREKGRRSQGRRLKKDRDDTVDSEENRVERDADNDVAVASGKLRTRASTLHDERRKHRSVFGRSSLDLDSKDGGSLSEHKPSSRELKVSRSQDGLEEEKENNGRRRQASGIYRRLADKVGSVTVSRSDDADDSVPISIAPDNTASTIMLPAVGNNVIIAEKTLGSKSLSVTQKGTTVTDPQIDRTMVEKQTQVTHQDVIEEEQTQVKERETRLTELQEKITGLESEKSMLLKQKDETQTLLEQKLREQETKNEDKEKEKILQKKLGELTTHVQRLERRIALLRTENEALRKKQDDQKPLEDKIRSLKKRNVELAAIARRLEEKAKALQHENTRAKS